jgi:hypothetical protein
MMHVASHDFTGEEGTVGANSTLSVKIDILQFTEGLFRFEPFPTGQDGGKNRTVRWEEPFG